MSSVDYLDGNIYHMVHVDTFKGILERRAILSKNRIRQEKLPYRSIAYEEVQSLRDRIFVWDDSIQKPRPLHSYVPLESFISLLNWGVINDRWFNDDEKKRIKHAEVLYPDLFPLGRISGISVMTQEMVQVVNSFIQESGLEGRIPRALCRSQLFFS